jgi:hypothetical protein
LKNKFNGKSINHLQYSFKCHQYSFIGGFGSKKRYLTKKSALKQNLFFFKGVKGHATNKKNEAVKNRETG